MDVNNDPLKISRTPSLSPAVSRALQTHGAVVALESTVISHGLPGPQNLETALGCEDEIRSSGAEPATIGIIAGRPVIGLENEQLDAIASREDVAKVSLSNMGEVIASRKWGATTVASTLHLAHSASIKLFSTGGIGGVHRGVGVTFDISSDLVALSRYPVIVVCSGVKSILDVPKTVETLETLGVPVIGYQTDEMPAFYSRKSGIRLEMSVDDPDEAVAIALAHWQTGLSTAVLFVQPVAADLEVPAEEIKPAIELAINAAELTGLTGREVTPFLLKRVVEGFGWRAVDANIALLRQNARLAGRIARSLSQVEVPCEY